MPKKQRIQKEKPSLGQDEINAKKKQVESRFLVSTFFVALLIGLAYQEMIAPVREAVRTSGITFSTFALVSIFFLTSIRFFIGNQLHLLSESLTKMPGLVWLYDLMVIVTQCVVLVFMAGDSTVKQNQSTTIGFVDLLTTLYVI
jgi:CDP-diglyceride synthetase